MKVRPKILRVIETSCRGRSLAVTEFVAAGTTVLLEEPAVCVPFTGSTISSLSPSSGEYKYSSTEVQMFKASGGSLLTGGLSMLAARVMIQLVNGKPNEMFKSTCKNLCNHCDRYPPDKREGVIACAKIVHRLVNLELSQKLQAGQTSISSGSNNSNDERCFSLEDCTEIICKLSSNIFTIVDDCSAEEAGLGLFCLASTINHDCNPNCVQTFDRSTGSILIRTVKDLDAGEELTISYIDSAKPRNVRQRELLDSYFFHCSCARCCGSDDIDGYLCTSCSQRESSSRMGSDIMNLSGGCHIHNCRTCVTTVDTTISYASWLRGDICTTHHPTTTAHRRAISSSETISNLQSVPITMLPHIELLLRKLDGTDDGSWDGQSVLSGNGGGGARCDMQPALESNASRMFVNCNCTVLDRLICSRCGQYRSLRTIMEPLRRLLQLELEFKAMISSSAGSGIQGRNNSCSSRSNCSQRGVSTDGRTAGVSPKAAVKFYHRRRHLLELLVPAGHYALLELHREFKSQLEILISHPHHIDKLPSRVTCEKKVGVTAACSKQEVGLEIGLGGLDLSDLDHQAAGLEAAKLRKLHVEVSADVLRCMRRCYPAPSSVVICNEVQYIDSTVHFGHTCCLYLARQRAGKATARALSLVESAELAGLVEFALSTVKELLPALPWLLEDIKLVYSACHELYLRTVESFRTLQQLHHALLS